MPAEVLVASQKRANALANCWKCNVHSISQVAVAQVSVLKRTQSRTHNPETAYIGNSTFVAAIFSNLLTATGAGARFLPRVSFKKIDCTEFPSAFPSLLFPLRDCLSPAGAGSGGAMDTDSAVCGAKKQPAAGCLS